MSCFFCASVNFSKVKGIGITYIINPVDYSIMLLIDVKFHLCSKNLPYFVLVGNFSCFDAAIQTVGRGTGSFLAISYRCGYHKAGLTMIVGLEDVREIVRIGFRGKHSEPVTPCS